MEITIDVPGTCPFCKSEDINQGHGEIESDMVGYKMVCNYCGQESIEWHSVEFSVTEGVEREAASGE